jgi:hypothetical protein
MDPRFFRKYADLINEAQQLDELSQDTLGSYADKATKDREQEYTYSKNRYDIGDSDGVVAGNKRMQKRQDGINTAYGKMNKKVAEDGQLDEIFGFGKKPLGSRERFAQDAKRVEKMDTAGQNAHHQSVADQINAHLGKYEPGKHQPITASQAMAAHVNALRNGSKENEIEVGDAQETGRILNKTHAAIGDVKKYHGRTPKEVSEENEPGSDRSWHQGASDARDGIEPAKSRAKPVGRDEEDAYNSGYNSYRSLPAKSKKVAETRTRRK